ncbi:MAG TPA: CDP-alcohol phosphatidyltransferase family protein [Flavisolibacter sp.]|nr:CDP-alcohol phosphatidyltransferase family protein [Flavisolibacter sp.]
MHRKSYYIINAITVYRLLSAFLLLYLIYRDRPDIFKWMIAISFFTDSIDGFLARKYHVVSVMGARIDSIADDMTVLMGIIGLFVWKPAFIQQEILLICFLLILFILQVSLAFLRYGKFSSFHTYFAKTAALFQGLFLIFAFFLTDMPYLLFYMAAVITAVDLIEEIILVFVIPEWRANVKGLYWVLKNKKVI